MADFRPEFFYHPAVGVVSPTSLELVKFKTNKFTFNAPPSSLPTPPAVKIPPKAEITETQPVRVSETSALAVTSELPPAPDVLKINANPAEELEMPKKISDTATCIVTGNELPLHEMVKFVLNPEGEVVPDLNNKLPGLSFYITAKREIIQKAIWRNSFTSSARQAVTVPKNLIETVVLGLLKQSLDSLALAKKAGQLTHGFAKVEEVLRAGKAKVYVVASDAKENGRQKLEKHLEKLTGSNPVLDIWTSAQLSAALGEDNAIHAALMDGALTDKIQNIANKLKDIR